MLSLLAGLLLGYLLGSIPTAALLARLRGRDVFAVGSGNMGAMNTARHLGLGLGALVLAVDVAKGALASYAGLTLAAALGASEPARLATALAAGLGAVLGHCFSAYVGFRGGKGLATTLGIALPLYPWGGLAGVAVLIVLTLLLRRRSGVAAVLTMVLYPGLVAFVQLRSGTPEPTLWAVTVGVTLVAMVVVLKHILVFRREAAAPGG